ncbi:unnamed protein product [Schistosoma rodhaini]|uniref:Fibronectin type-III domain-containing protein n=1 Tax=Schistosoma rodhaini TaxID=6188 RepID=A0AA85FBX4_9TREM|nr:unnamed protein product [Schistosoma rodhaini]
MYTNRCLVNVILITLISVNAQNEFNQIDSPTIIDSLTFPLIIDDLNVENEQVKFPIKEQITPKNVYHTEPISVRRRNSNQSDYKSKYFDKPNIGNEFNYSVFDVGESLCPDVYCFAKRLSSSDELTFDCKSQSFEVTSEDTMIDCHYWHVPSPGADSNQQRQSKQHGKGYDLRIVLKPSTISADDLSSKSNSASRLRISHLKPGVLNWIIETVRLSLKMPLSPVHLTISFIYFKRLGRDDLGNLATKSRVTHLSLWNPFYWDEDSFIPITNKTSKSSNNAGYLDEGPPYFRLSLFCDYENQNPSFRRLWFPWKSWQLRLTHCPDLYNCWHWYSKYPICDLKQSTDNPERLLKSFIPSYLISPKSLMSSPQSLKQETGMQILYDNQCLPNPNQTNIVSDLKMNYRDQCLQSDNDKPVRDIQTSKTTLQQTTEMRTTTASVIIMPTTINTATTVNSTPRTTTTVTTPLVTTSKHSSITPLSTTSTFTTTTTTENKTDLIIKIDKTTNSLNLTKKEKSQTASILNMNTSKIYPTDLSFNQSNIWSPNHKETTFLDQKSNFNKTIPIILNQDNLIKDGISTEYLTSGLILLAILNIILIICFIILVLWIRRRIKVNSKNKLTNFHELYQDYSGIDIIGSNNNNSLYATNHCPLLISTITGSYISGSHPKLNQRHHSFPNSSLSYSQNFNTFLPMSTYKTNNNHKYNSNQSQQFLLGRSTSYSSSMWNGSLKNGLNNNHNNSSKGYHNERVLLTNRLYSKRHLNYSLNGLSIESSQQISSTPYINQKENQLINLPLPYHHKEIKNKYSSQTLNPSLISSSSLTTVNVAEVNTQKEREYKSIYGSRNRLSNGQPSPTPLREIKKSPVVNYRKSKRKIGSGRPPLASSIKKQHTLVFEDDKWSEDFKTSLHKL